MAISAFAPLAVFVVVVGTIGWRLLALWRRTRREPELLLGLGLVLVSCVAIPLAGIGRIPEFALTPIGRTSFALGMVTIAVSAALLMSFTQRVFRPRERWARVLAAGTTAVLSAAVVFICHVNFTGASVAEIVSGMRPGTVVLIGCMLAGFAWASAEAFHYHGAARRRLALGLADPVVVDRFYLWGVSSAANTLLLGVLLYCVDSGMVILRHAMPLSTMAVVGTLMSATWYLTFLPPARYLDYVRRRAS